MSGIEIERELNPEQCEAATHEGGPILILAGAGSGKTRTLIYRILHLTTRAGFDPGSILAVTFTNKAAGEMRERLTRAIGPDDARRAWMYTFHGACLRILRREIEGRFEGFTRDFGIYDRDLQLNVIKRALEVAGVSDRIYSPARMLSAIGHAKNRLLTPETLAAEAQSHPDEVAAAVFGHYQALLRSNNALDFDDLIGKTVELFREHEEIRAYYQRYFQHVLVDEYQDTNHAQYQLIALLADAHRNLAVVGDDDQSIYRFRGADVQNILDFQRDFPDAKVVRLERNYRSTQNILAAASAVVAKNQDRLGKTLWTENEVGELIDLYEASDERAEGRWVAREIHALVNETEAGLGDVAVFYRTNAQSRALEEAFRNAAIPYRMVGALRFYDRAEIRDLVAYLRACVNPSDGEAVRRIINRPTRGIGGTTLGKLERFARARTLSLAEALERIDAISDIGTAARRKVVAFTELFDELRADALRMPPGQFIRHLLDRTEYREWIHGGGHGKTPEDIESRLENIGQLVASADEFAADFPEAGVAPFLDRVSLVSDADNYDDGAQAATLMTLHCAKGLEFPIVFMTGVEEGIFPHARSVEEGRHAVEEERRLCYVGLTRAKQRLLLSFARERATIGPRRPSDPSRFLSEIPLELLHLRNTGAARAQGAYVPAFRRSRRGWQRPFDAHAHDVPPDDFDQSAGWDDVSQVSATIGGFQAGQRVQHPQFGDGTVLEATGTHDNPKLSIRFERGGVRKVMARVADLLILD